MANHKSALKRDKQSKVRRLRNRVNKTQMKGAVNKVDEAIAAGSEQQVREATAAGRLDHSENGRQGHHPQENSITQGFQAGQEG